MTLLKTNGSPGKSPDPRQIAIIGTGYVGLVTGACFAELGNSVVCLDNDARKIATLRLGEVPFYEPHLLDMVIRNRRAGRLAFSEDVEAGVRASSIIFIAVGTPILPDDGVDLSAGGQPLGPLSNGTLNAGRTFRTSDASSDVAVADASYAKSANLKVGSDVTIANTKFPVVGIVTDPAADSSADIYIPLGRA